MAPTNNPEKKTKVLKDTVDEIKKTNESSKKLNQAEKDALSRLDNELAAIETEVVADEVARDFNAQIKGFQSQLGIESKNDGDVNPDKSDQTKDKKDQPVDEGQERIKRQSSRAGILLNAAKNTGKETKLAKYNNELKILKEMLDYISVTDKALWNEIIKRNRGNNVGDDITTDTDSKKRATRQQKKGTYEVDDTDYKFDDVKDRPKLLYLGNRLAKLGREYEKLQTINEMVPFITDRIDTIESEVRSLSSDVAYDLDKNKNLDSKNDKLIKAGLLKSDGTPTEEVSQILQDANIAAKAAKSPNAAVHIYNDLSDKLATKIGETGWLTKDEASGILSFAPWLLGFIYAPDLWSAIPGGVLQKIVTLGSGGYILDKVLKNKSPELIAKYEKGKIITETVGTSGKEYYRLGESSEFKTGKMIIDMIGGQFKDDQDSGFFDDYLKGGRLQVTQMVNDFRGDGSINDYLKKDDNTIQIMSILEVMLKNGQEKKIQNGVEAYLNDIGLITSSHSSTGSAQGLTDISMRSINNKYAEYVKQAQQIYTELQKLGKYEITKLGAENRKKIQTILNKTNTAQDKVHELIQEGYIIGSTEKARTRTEFTTEIKDIANNSNITEATHRTKDGLKLEPFVTQMHASRDIIESVFGQGNEYGFTLRTASDDAGSHTYIQSMDRKTEFVRNDNNDQGSYILKFLNNGLISGSPEQIFVGGFIFNRAWTMIGALGDDPWETTPGGKIAIKSGLLNKVKGVFGIDANKELENINLLIDKISTGANSNPNFISNIVKILNDQTMNKVDEYGNPVLKDGKPERVSLFSQHSRATDPEYLAIGKNGEKQQFVGYGRKDQYKKKEGGLTINNYGQWLGSRVYKYGLKQAFDLAEYGLVGPSYEKIKSVGVHVLDDAAEGFVIVYNEGKSVLRPIAHDVMRGVFEGVDFAIDLGMPVAGKLIDGSITLGGKVIEGVADKMGDYLNILASNPQAITSLKQIADGLTNYTINTVEDLGKAVVRTGGELIKTISGATGTLSWKDRGVLLMLAKFIL